MQLILLNLEDLAMGGNMQGAKLEDLQVTKITHIER